MPLCSIKLMLFICTATLTLCAHAVQLNFCYEDKQLLPYYTGEALLIPPKPGATIEHLQSAVRQVPGLSLSLQRLPWLRCLQQLETGKVDAVVATYSAKRNKFAVYPKLPDGKLDPNRAMSTHATCLAHKSDNNISAKIQNKVAQLTVSRPLGYATPDFPPAVTVINVRSQQQAVELVVSGRVDATTTLCQVNNIVGADSFITQQKLTILYPPLYHTTGYLIFSDAFYKQQPVLANALWQALGNTIVPQQYFDYLNYGAEQTDSKVP